MKGDIKSDMNTGKTGGPAEGLIKEVFALEIHHRKAGTPPVKPVPAGLTKQEKREGREDTLSWFRVFSAASFIVVFFAVLVLMKDSALRSPLVYRAAGIEKLFPENPAEAFYAFLFETNASL